MANFHEKQPFNEYEAEAALAAEAAPKAPETKQQLAEIHHLGKIELDGAEVQIQQAA